MLHRNTGMATVPLDLCWALAPRPQGLCATFITILQSRSCLLLRGFYFPLGFEEIREEPRLLELYIKLSMNKLGEALMRFLCKLHLKVLVHMLCEINSSFLVFLFGRFQLSADEADSHTAPILPGRRGRRPPLCRRVHHY